MSPATGTLETPQPCTTLWKLKGGLRCESKRSFNIRTHAQPYPSMKRALVSVHPAFVAHLYGLCEKVIIVFVFSFFTVQLFYII